MTFVLQLFNKKSVSSPATLAIAALIVLAEAFVLWPHATVVLLLATAAWMAWPGVWLVRAVFGPRDPSGIGAWLAGPALGLGVSVFGAFLWWAAGVQGWLVLLLGPVLTWLLTWGVRRAQPIALKVPAFGHRDVPTAALLVLLVPLITWAPYDHVREPVHDGEAYRAYYTADFIWAMTVVSELARGDVPPKNPFLRDQPLRYYWMAHFLSGAVYRNVAALGVPLEAVILVNGLAFSAAFVLFMYGLARAVGAAPAAAALAVVCGFCANSYEGADMLRAVATGRIPWSEIANTNIDAITRWFYKGMAVDGLQRLMLYQPHHLTGYVLGITALWLVALADDVTAVGVALAAGSLLALALLFSTFGALIISGAVGLLYGLRLIQQRALGRVWQCAILGGGPVVLGVALTSFFGYADNRYGSLLLVGLNPVALHNAGRIWIMSFGPLLFGAIAACLMPRWRLAEGGAPLALVASATMFYFFTNVPDSGDVWVGWRSGHMLLIAFAVMSAVWLTRVWAVERWRLAVVGAVLVLVIPAAPTVAFDVYNAQDITNRTQGAGFPWTLVITPAEREALEWVRHNTPPDAVVQIDPDARGPAHWSYIGAFAERRMVAGLPGSMTPLRPYRLASDAVKWDVFKTTQAADCHASARFLGIDYLFIGAPERRWYGSAIHAMRSDPALFPVVFENSAVTILRVAPTGPGPISTRVLSR